MSLVRSLLFAVLLVAPPAFAGDRGHHHDGPDVDVDLGIDLFSMEHDGPRERIRVLDFLVVSAFELDRRPNHERIEVLDAPLVSLYRTKRDHDESSLRVLSLPFASLFRMDQDGDASDLRVLHLPIVGSLFRHQSWDDRQRTEALFLFSVETSKEGTAPPAAQ